MAVKYDVRKDGVTQSVLGTFLSCRRKAKLSVLEGWQSVKPKATFMFGEIAHAILEEVYSKEKYGIKPPSIKRMKKIIDRHADLWRKEHETNLDDNLLDALEFNCAKLEAVLPEYFKYWHDKDFKKTKWLGLEKEFVFMVNGIPVRGKRDGEYEQDKSIFLFETKTKSQIDERSLYEVLPIDFQTNLYSLSIKKEYGKWPSGVRYNIIRNPGSKLKKNESLQQYTERLRKEIQKDPKHYFIRFFIYRPKSELESFEKEFKTILQEFVQWHDGQIPDYKNTNSCTNKYGTCSMIDICAMNNYKKFKKRTKLYSELSYNREV